MQLDPDRSVWGLVGEKFRRAGKAVRIVNSCDSCPVTRRTEDTRCGQNSLSWSSRMQPRCINKDTTMNVREDSGKRWRPYVFSWTAVLSSEPKFVGRYVKGKISASPSGERRRRDLFMRSLNTPRCTIRVFIAVSAAISRWPAPRSH